VANLKGRPFQKLTPAQAALVRRYGPGRKANLDPCNPVTVRSYPVVQIGRYLETLSNEVICADFSTQVSPPGAPLQNEPLSFSEIQSRIIGDVRTTGTDVNAEANVITALICREDRLQPSRVCARPVIKALLKHIK
jgi:hypothetical protein